MPPKKKTKAPHFAQDEYTLTQAAEALGISVARVNTQIGKLGLTTRKDGIRKFLTGDAVAQIHEVLAAKVN